MLVKLEISQQVYKKILKYQNL